MEDSLKLLKEEVLTKNETVSRLEELRRNERLEDQKKASALELQLEEEKKKCKKLERDLMRQQQGNCFLEERASTSSVLKQNYSLAIQPDGNKWPPDVHKARIYSKHQLHSDTVSVAEHSLANKNDLNSQLVSTSYKTCSSVPNLRKEIVQKNQMKHILPGSRDKDPAAIQWEPPKLAKRRRLGKTIKSSKVKVQKLGEGAYQSSRSCDRLLFT